MKTTRFSTLPFLLAGLTFCGASLPYTAQAQPEAPAKAKKPRAPKTEKPAGKQAAKPRAKNLTTRMVTATEEAMGKPLTPEMKTRLTTALREREVAIQAANAVYYAAFAQASGLTAEQAKEIDKPSRAGAKKPTAPKVEGTTNMDALTDNEDDNTGAPVTPR